MEHLGEQRLDHERVAPESPRTQQHRARLARLPTHQPHHAHLNVVPVGNRDLLLGELEGTAAVSSE